MVTGTPWGLENDVLHFHRMVAQEGQERSLTGETEELRSAEEEVGGSRERGPGPSCEVGEGHISP